jgi:hypothetical protein
LARLEAAPEKEPFDGDPKRFRETTELHLGGVIYLDLVTHLLTPPNERC